MKRIKTISHAIFVMFILSLSATCCGQEDLDILTPMEKVELEALYSTIESFLGDSWNSSDLYPDPCGWTPIQGVSCDLFDGFCRNNLTGNLSLKLETLPYLNALYLSGNNLIRQSLASLKTFLEKWEGVLGIGTTQNFANKLD
ncbi:Piriformospora indica-insensitive protein 2 [Glycine soja]|uniref:Piriformospora indica-insensitive protein 2 n=1 Tax=Glycine soja TaxID=3848 RepID=A0A0B2Q7N7_GLYSO|nr:Piriformospora indica-insensitive protein 2 [Glycine soja]